jgi:type IV pilus assembly protein PilY1
MDGNIWRMDLDDASSSNPSSNWKLHKLASLGSGRKFFFPPDVVLTSGYAAVLIGSGDREKPLDQNSTDRIYMVKDVKTGLDGSGQAVTSSLSTTCSDATGLIRIGHVDSGTGLGVSDGCTDAQIAAAKGWYYDLRTGEKVVNGPLTVGGVVYLGTNMPTPGAVCTGNLGRARSYALDFFNGAGAAAQLGGTTGSLDDPYSVVLAPLTGLPPSPVAGLVDIPGVGVVPFCIGCGENHSALEANIPDIDPSPLRRKVFWKFKNDK